MLLSNSAENDIDAVLSELKTKSILIDSEVIVGYKMKNNQAILCRGEFSLGSMRS